MQQINPPAYRCIAVVGGGFGGAMFAIELARSAKEPLHIIVIEPRPQVGQGLAYGSARAEHRMNTLTDNLVMFKADPMHFRRWVQDGGHDREDPDALVDGEHHFAQRRLFGAYMTEQFAAEAKANPSGSVLEHVQARAVDIARSPQGIVVTLEDGRRIVSHAVAICMSHDLPAWPWPSTMNEQGARGLVRDPWAPDALDGIALNARVFIVGTALTMADTVVSLRGRGHRGPIVAMSTRALLPREQLDFPKGFDFLEGREPPGTALALLRLTRRRAREVENASWRAAADGARSIVGTLWQALPLHERAKLVRHLRSFWDVHRFRMSPQVANTISAGRRDGWLQVRVGRVVDIRRAGAGFDVESRHAGSHTREHADVVINCTGPSSDVSNSRNPAIQSLLRHGLARSDSLRLGFDLDAQSRLIAADGASNPDLWVVGAMARPLFGEVVGIPQTSTHARAVANLVAEALVQLRADARPEPAPRPASGYAP